MRNEILETTRRLMAKDLLPLMGAMDQEGHDAAAWSAVAGKLEDTGILRMPLPETAGGIGFDLPLMGAVLRILSEGCAGIAALLWAHYSALLPFLLDARGRAVAEEAAKAGMFLLGAGYISSFSAEAKKNGAAYSVIGTLPYVWGVPGAARVSVAAADGSGGIFCAAPVGDRAVVTGTQKRIGLRGCASSSMDLRGLEPDPRLSLVLPGPEYTRLLDLSRACAQGLVGAMAVGNARGAFAKAHRYAGERYQGGAVLIAHTLIQGMLGDMRARILAADALVDQALSAVDPVRGGASRVARAVATRAGETACSDGMQVLGGYGYMKEYGMEKHLRDAKMLCAVGESNMRILQGSIRDMKDGEVWP